MKLVLFGAANPETIRVIRSIERNTVAFEFSGFLDNDPAKWDTQFFGYPVLGGIEQVASLAASPEIRFVNLITGSTRVRYEVTREIVRRGGILGNFIHPSVDLTMVELGIGSYIQEAVILQAAVTVGDNCSLHMNAIVGHESTIGHSVFVAHAVSISGCCRIGDGSFIGTNAIILPRVSIGKWCTIGAGAVVTKNVPDYAVVVGNPGKIIKQNEIPYADASVLIADSVQAAAVGPGMA